MNQDNGCRIDRGRRVSVSAGQNQYRPVARYEAGLVETM